MTRRAAVGKEEALLLIKMEQIGTQHHNQKNHMIKALQGNNENNDTLCHVHSNIEADSIK